ncbi:hypothetical protein SAY87_021019 [Trapa incisa]|uniref:Uncharacterized protein n=1 Tax=Trapa incisa TaxID=236973 RepID=A0AAN7PQC7_9MYRT|nr:hypothetical protein SAY87_021019 [Trapa incisa]
MNELGRTEFQTVRPFGRGGYSYSHRWGGRLCNGEKGVQVELKRNFDDESPPSRTHVIDEDSLASAASGASSVPEDAFEKEMMGLTGGFPGREKGQKLFIEKNPPPPKKAAISMIIPSSKPNPPELPLLMPGMIAIAKNPNNPFYMYWGIVQRIPAR